MLDICLGLFKTSYFKITHALNIKNGPTGAVVRASPSYDVKQQTDGQDHILSQADALTKN